MCAILLSPFPSYASQCINSVVVEDSPFHFLRRFTDGLNYAQTSIKRYTDKTETSSDADSISSQLSVITLGKADLECAESQVAAYRMSSHAIIRQSAEVAASSFAQLARLQQQTLLDFQAAINAGPKNFKPWTFMARQAERVSAIDEAWKRLVPVAILATYSVMDKNLSTGRVSNLALTARQRNEILEKLRATFGTEISEGNKSGHKAAVAAGPVLYEVLSNQQRTLHPK